jgi:hypothetical protein
MSGGAEWIERRFLIEVVRSEGTRSRIEAEELLRRWTAESWVGHDSAWRQGEPGHSRGSGADGIAWMN